MWISWLRIASGQQHDPAEAGVRSLGRAAGRVDVTVSAADEIWSCRKFVYRRVER
jgi:hypothetical protein